MNDAFLRAIADGSYWVSGARVGSYDTDEATTPAGLAAEALRLRGLVADATWHEGALQRQAARAVEAERQRDEARERARGDLAVLDEVRTILGAVGVDLLTHARLIMQAVERQRVIAAERDEARRAALRWEGNADQMERERDDAKARARHATQLIVEAIGSVGPESVEDAVPRVLAALDKAHERETALLVRVGYAEERLRLSVAAWDAAGMQGRDAASVIREAQEQGARWAIEAWHRDDLQTGPAAEEAARICAEARKAGEHG